MLHARMHGSQPATGRRIHSRQLQADLRLWATPGKFVCTRARETPRAFAHASRQQRFRRSTPRLPRVTLTQHSPVSPFSERKHISDHGPATSSPARLLLPPPGALWSFHFLLHCTHIPLHISLSTYLNSKRILICFAYHILLLPGASFYNFRSQLLPQHSVLLEALGIPQRPSIYFTHRRPVHDLFLTYPRVRNQIQFDGPKPKPKAIEIEFED